MVIDYSLLLIFSLTNSAPSRVASLSKASSLCPARFITIEHILHKPLI